MPTISLTLQMTYWWHQQQTTNTLIYCYSIDVKTLDLRPIKMHQWLLSLHSKLHLGSTDRLPLTSQISWPMTSTTRVFILLYIEVTISFLIGQKCTVNFQNQHLWCHVAADYKIIMSRTLKVTGNRVMYDCSDWFPRVIMSSSRALCCMPSVKKQKHDFLELLIYCYLLSHPAFIQFFKDCLMLRSFCKSNDVPLICIFLHF